MPDSLAGGVVFGLGAAWGYAPSDLVSPAQAARAGAFTNSTPEVAASGFTELRLQGASGSDGPMMLGHPTVLQVAGGATARFYRRWGPSGSGGAGIPWKLEAYSWGGLAKGPVAAALWFLFAPFMIYNVAHFTLPPAAVSGAAGDGPGHAPTPSRDGRHAWAEAVPAAWHRTTSSGIPSGAGAPLTTRYSTSPRAVASALPPSTG